jgi:hypothetical protein
LAGLTAGVGGAVANKLLNPSPLEATKSEDQLLESIGGIIKGLPAVAGFAGANLLARSGEKDSAEAVRPSREQQLDAGGDSTRAETTDGVRRDRYALAKLQIAPRHRTTIQSLALIGKMR